MRTDTPARRVAVPLHLSQRAAAAAPAGHVVHALNGTSMGTRWSVKLAAPAAARFDALRTGIERTLERIVAEMSTWETGSDISAFNRAPAGSWHGLPRNFFHVLQYAMGVARDTDGAYDPTVSPLVALWGFGPHASARTIPTADEIAAARASVGWNRVVLDPSTRTAKQPGGAHLDLLSVAKGFAVDKLAEVLRGAGYGNFLVEIGGELRGEGVKPDGMPWWVALERPPATGTHDAPLADVVVALNGLSVATSGSAEHFFDVRGRRYSHTIDPRVGAPIAHDLVSVTVLHRECMHADALSTALTVLGPDEGLAHALRIGLAARFVAAGPDGLRERLTPRFAAMLA
jgi:thiamine biosynthesis lipoprotein